ncbi:MAG: ferritin-like domain-containing protein [Quisquiliibacterium sp.]
MRQTYEAASDAATVAALRHLAHQAWQNPDPADKCRQVARISEQLARTDSVSGHLGRALHAGAALEPAESLDAPGRPALPRLVQPAKLPRRSMTSAQGRAALLHSIAHIEFNAVNLALDAAWRFEQMPAQFCLDWLSVAVDEARHFMMIERLLRVRGHAYGDFDAHDGLWEMAERTRGDVLERMALVPRVLEARGLDATPQIQAKLRQVGDQQAADMLEVILREEVRHVALGDYWFKRLCAERRVQPDDFFLQAMRRHRAPRLRGQINRAARIAAGFSQSELDALLALPEPATDSET